MNTLKLYIHYLRVAARGQMTYPASLLFTLIGQFLVSFGTFVAVWFMMDRFHEVQGFQRAEVLIAFAVTLMSFSMAELFFRGFDTFASLLADGSFDRMLVRPRGIILQVLGSRTELSRLGRLGQAIWVLAYALPRSAIDWNLPRILVLIEMILCGILIYAALFTIQASLTFHTTEGLEVMNILTDGSREFGQYPYAIYGPTVLRILTFVVPLALVQYYPLLWLLGRDVPSYYAVLPLLSTLFLIPAQLLWRLGVRKYTSTGS